MSDFCTTERNKLHRWGRFQLPNVYKKVGWSIVASAFALMIAKGFFDEPTWVKPVLRNLMILGFLMVSISKEKIEDELKIFLPEAKIARMDFDTVRTKNAHAKIINDFEEKRLDILVGTQMVTKGLDFDNVGVVGVLSADHLLQDTFTVKE